MDSNKRIKNIASRLNIIGKKVIEYNRFCVVYTGNKGLGIIIYNELSTRDINGIVFDDYILLDNFIILKYNAMIKYVFVEYGSNVLDNTDDELNYFSLCCRNGEIYSSFKSHTTVIQAKDYEMLLLQGRKHVVLINKYGDTLSIKSNHLDSLFYIVKSNDKLYGSWWGPYKNGTLKLNEGIPDNNREIHIDKYGGQDGY